MYKVIIPETKPDVKKLKSILTQALGPRYFVWIHFFNKNEINIYKPLGIMLGLHIKSDKILVINPMSFYGMISFLFCVPFAIYLLIKRKEGDALRESVYEIVLQATKKP